MQRTNLYLNENQTAALDEIATGQCISRAELVRRLIDKGLDSTSDDLDADLAAIDASYGAAHDAAVPGREPDRRAAHLDRMRDS